MKWKKRKKKKEKVKQQYKQQKLSNNISNKKKSRDLAHREGHKSYATLLTLRYASEVRMKGVKNDYFYIWKYIKKKEA